MINRDGHFRNSHAWKYNHRSVRMGRAFVNDKPAIDNNRAVRAVKAVHNTRERKSLVEPSAIFLFFFLFRGG